MRLYVTGGTGFVGSNIVKVALERYSAAVFSTVHSRLPEGTPGVEYGRVNMVDPQQGAKQRTDLSTQCNHPRGHIKQL